MTSKRSKRNTLRKRIAFSQNMIRTTKAEYSKERGTRASDGYLDLLIELSEYDIEQSLQKMRNL